MLNACLEMALAIALCISITQVSRSGKIKMLSFL